MILVSYDGSADAQAAVDRVAQLMPGAEATVLTVWEPFIYSLARTGSLGMGMAGTYAYIDSEKIDAANREAGARQRHRRRAAGHGRGARRAAAG